jgi:tRNA(fMet)-specific endonuclease VapC
MPLPPNGLFAMSGDRYLLDTNAIVALLQGDADLIRLIQNADWVGIAIISHIEFLAFAGLTEDDKALFREFLTRVEVIGLAVDNLALIEQIIDLRQRYRLKLPDAIIGAISIQNSANLITADQAFSKIAELTVMTW